MDRFIGLDVHGQSCTVAVMGPSGRRLGQQVVETNGKALVGQVRSIAGQRHLCMEEGAQSEWLYEVLEPHVDELVVVQALKSQGPKSDALDSWALAEMIRSGSRRRSVFKAPRRFTSLRQAVRGYVAVQRDLVRAKNRLHALYRSRGVTPTADIYDADGHRLWLSKLPAQHRPLAERLSAEVQAIASSFDPVESWLLEEAERVPVIRRLQTVPGIGVVRAALIVAIVVTPQRFRTVRQFWSYCGLGIVMRSSSDWVRESQGWVRKQVGQTRGLNRNRQPLLKAVFKGAATTVIAQQPQQPLHQAYQQMLKARTKPNLAKLTLARRIASATLAIWKHEEDYDPTKHRRLSQS